MKSQPIHIQWVRHKMNKRNWSVKDGKDLYKFPKWLLRTVYSKTDMVWHKGRFIKGRVKYYFIPPEFTIDTIPIIVDLEVDLNQILPRDAVFLSYEELKQIFKNNKYSD